MPEVYEDDVKWLESRLDEQDNLLKSLQAQITELSQSWKTNSNLTMETIAESEQFKNLIAEIRQTQLTASEISSRLATLLERSQSRTVNPASEVQPDSATPPAQPDASLESLAAPTSPKKATHKVRVL